MTRLQIEELFSEEEELARQRGLTVKCSWCGVIMRLDGREHDLAMCQTCYDRMLGEFLSAQREKIASQHASDR